LNNSSTEFSNQQSEGEKILSAITSVPSRIAGSITGGLGNATSAASNQVLGGR